MKKIILLTILFLIFPVFVNAEESDDLIYDVESVTIDDDKITFNGWAYVSDIHTIGGKNYDISIYAVEEDNRDNYLSNTVRTVKSSTASYTGENRLYPSTCFKTDGENGRCIEVYYGYYTNIKNKTGGKGTIGNNKSYASCRGDTTSCIHYNPNFSISFRLSDLIKTFGENEFTFVIHINYKKYDKINAGGSTGCRYTENGYEGCYIKSKDRTGGIYRYLAFDKSVVNEYDTLTKMINKVTINLDSRLKINTYYGRLRDSDGSYHKEATTSTYFNPVPYSVKSSVTGVPVSDAGTGLSSKLTLYELNTAYFDNHSEGDVHVSPGTNKTAYAWSTWGIITGEVVMSLMSEPPKPPSYSCSRPSVNNTCKNSDYTISDCEKEIVYMNDTDDVNLNLDGCSETGEHKSYYKIIRGYVFNETNTLKMNTNFDNTYFPGLGVPFSFDFSRYINWSTNETYKKYYYVKYSYKNSINSCVVEDGYVTRNYLISKGIDLSNEDALLDATANNLVSQEHKVVYKYPNSNDVTKSVYSSSKYIEDIGYKTVKNGVALKYNYSINNAYIKRDNSEKCYNKSECNNPNYLNGEKKYYIPFNIKDFSTPLNFITEIRNSSMLLDNISLISNCNMNIDLGPLEKARYRVIDLSDPFPNNEPSATHATNWLSLWNSSSNTFLFDRRYANNVESYKLDLNISKIREYNDSKNNYLDTSINITDPDNGRSSFISNDYFNRIDIKNITLMRVGKGEVDS